MTLGQCPSSEEEHRSHQFVRKWGSDSAAVRSKKVVLECFALFATNVSRRQRAKSGCDAVDDVTGVDCFLDNPPRRGKSLR